MTRLPLKRGWRIAVSTVFGTACLLAFVLWMLSYNWHSKTFFNLPFGWRAFVASEQGIVGIRVRDSKRTAEYGMMLPHVLFVACFGGIATALALGWFPKRISVRTLLIATTLTAVLLGLIVWSSR